MARLSVDKEMRRARTQERNGDNAGAREIYRQILEVFPRNVRAAKALKAIDSAEKLGQVAGQEKAAVSEIQRLQAQGALEQAAAKAEALAGRQPNSAAVWSLLASVSHQAGRIDRMEFALRKACEISPENAAFHSNLGSALFVQSRLEEAGKAYRAALAIDPDYAEAYNNLAGVQRRLGDLEGSLANYERAIALKPDYRDPAANRCALLVRLGRPDEATAAAKDALATWPDMVEAWRSLGSALRMKGQFEDAEAALRNCLTIAPNDIDAKMVLGSILSARGKSDEGIALLREGVRQRPDSSLSHFNLGLALRNAGMVDEAFEAYREATRLNPADLRPQINLGVLQRDEGDIQAALNTFEGVLAIDPDNSRALAQMGDIQLNQGNVEEALSKLEKATASEPDNQMMQILKLSAQLSACDWSDFKDLDLTRVAPRSDSDPAPPFTSLAIEDNPANQLLRSKAFAQRNLKAVPRPFDGSKPRRPGRLRLGYFSSDFHDHATLYLMAGMFREHDRNKVEVFAYSYGLRKEGRMRELVKGDIEHFFDVAGQPSDQIVDLARGHELDIAIDLKGFTRDSRSELFAHRLAPIQVNYLGFPSTMGTDCIDYIFVDQTVVPEEEQVHFSEEVIYLPHSYFPVDREQEISDVPTTRADYGLPEDGFVFCCFNQSYKFSPDAFDIWMRVMGKVEGSVLWLLGANSLSESNLRREAQARGIDPGRLIFADKRPNHEHVARQKHADLFVDTFNYNAHTTAVDALAAGLPVVTKMGRQFPSRVGASLLRALGMPELITDTEEAYEALILELATTPERLSKIREKLVFNRDINPLFDTKLFTENFETALIDIFRKSIGQLA